MSPGAVPARRTILDGEARLVQALLSDAGTGRTLSESVSAVVAEALALLRRGLAERDRAGFRAGECSPQDRQCLDELALSLSYVLDTLIRPAFASGELSLQWLVTLYGGDAVEAALIEELLRSSSEPERIAVLAAMEQTHGLPNRQLPAQAYAHLREHSAQEALLLLGRHESTPVTDSELVEDLAAMALDGTLSDAYRYAAVESLGHPETAGQLDGIVGSLVATDDFSTTPALVRRVEVAVVRCGAACSGSIESLAASSNSQVRATAYSIVPRLAATERAAVVDRIAALAPRLMEPGERMSFERAMAASGN